MHYLFLWIAHCRVDKYNCNNANDDYISIICYEIWVDVLLLCSMSEDKKKVTYYVCHWYNNQRIAYGSNSSFFSFFLILAYKVHILYIYINIDRRQRCVRWLHYPFPTGFIISFDHNAPKCLRIEEVAAPAAGCSVESAPWNNSYYLATMMAQSGDWRYIHICLIAIPRRDRRSRIQATLFLKRIRRVFDGFKVSHKASRARKSQL